MSEKNHSHEGVTQFLTDFLKHSREILEGQIEHFFAFSDKWSDKRDFVRSFSPSSYFKGQNRLLHAVKEQ